jgi:DNA-binding ferritin-like protein
MINKKTLNSLIEAIFDEGGQNAEMIAEMLEDERIKEYDDGIIIAEKLLKEMNKIIKRNNKTLLKTIK